MTAAGRAKRLDPDLRISVVEASPFISYSICGLPYYVSGVVGDHQDLVTFTPETLESERGIQARTGVRADQILTGKRTLACTELATGQSLEMEYDRLVICTGYTPRRPEIEGLDLRNVLTVSRLEHGIQIRELANRPGCRRVAVVGAGYVGLMMAHGLGMLGREVSLFDRSRHVFKQIDDDMAEVVEEELRRRGVRLFLDANIHRLAGRDGVFEAVEAGGERFEADLALIDVGVRPNVELAESSGVPLGMSGAVQVDDRGLTEMAGVYAAGNCAETRHLVSGRPIFSALGTTAAKQGRVVGENLAGRRSVFRGSLETSVEKVFDLGVGRTGLTLREAQKAGFDAKSVHVRGRHRASYYPGSAEMHVKLIFEKRTGRLLGGQIIGSEESAKRVDTLVAALTGRMTLEDLAQMDLAYAPPYGTLWDPIQIAANVALRRS